jgi:copper resistance protein C
MRRAGAALTTVALGALAAGLGLVAAAPVSAHASLVRMVPGDGSTVTAAPGRVKLVFDENVRTPASVVVVGPSGDRVQHGSVRVVDNTASIKVDLQDSGRYTVAFRVVSGDGHPVSAQTTFRFAPGGTAQAGAEQHSAHTGHGSATADDSGFGRGRVIGIVAVGALIAGLALLTVRRPPGGVMNPRGRGGP